MSYKHLSITERELIAIYRAEGKTLSRIANLLGRNKRVTDADAIDRQWSPEQIANSLNRGKPRRPYR